MDEYIAMLEKEIKQQTRLLEYYISHRQWQKAGLQQEYIDGLKRSLHLATATCLE